MSSNNVNISSSSQVKHPPGYHRPNQSGHKLFCSYAVTGPQETFQPIFVCHTCSKNPDDLLCICQACADECHDDHDDLAYVGMGPCYCDCSAVLGNCKICDASEAEAQRLQASSLASSLLTVPPALSTNMMTSHQKYVMEAFTIDTLQNSDMLRQMQEQARVLVQHSKETFWLDETIPTSELCGLERLAQQIFRQDCASFGVDMTVVGAEFWVQLKPVSGKYNEKNAGAEAIDLHYDKDEAMAESFGLGCFPVMSTVTYLTSPSFSPPTVVFERRYDENEDDPIQEMLISHPSLGKHLVFDGRLVHGAPSHYALRRPDESHSMNLDGDSSLSNMNTTQQQTAADRITFLVNIWVNHKPAAVQPLPSTLRELLRQDPLGWLPPLPAPTFIQRLVSERSVDSVTNTDLSRMELPFVGKGSTWAEDDDDEQMVVSLVPPPLAPADDTVLYHFGPELAAYVCVPEGVRVG